jgi:hypothetical protein
MDATQHSFVKTVFFYLEMAFSQDSSSLYRAFEYLAIGTCYSLAKELRHVYGKGANEIFCSFLLPYSITTTPIKRLS